MKNAKTLLSVILIMFIGINSLYAQFPDNVTAIDAVPNKITSIKGDLVKGFIMEDLSWASTSSNACFVATQNKKYTGNHVLHGFKIPEYSEVFITVIPDDKNANFSIYGYQVGSNSYPVVPNLVRCVSCEAQHKWDYKRRNQTQDHTRTIRFNSTTNTYNIFIGVAGANGLKTGTYTLKIDLKSRVKNTSEQKPLKMYRAPSEKGTVKAYKGDLKDGVKVHDLSWASKSSVACFPATQNKKFRGNHIIYLTELPARSKMTITLIPDDKKANMSLYAYSAGSHIIVPKLNSCVSCEADHKWDYPKRGKTQDHTRSVYLNAVNNPYNGVIGVGGVDGVTTGTFTVAITI